MPGVEALRQSDDNSRRLLDQADGHPENMKLYMPSEVPHTRNMGTPRLFQTEAKLRRAQCHDALELVRGRLLCKRHLVTFRNLNVTGQRESTRASTLIASMSEKLSESVSKYRSARQALVQLVGEDRCGNFRELKDEDVAVYVAAESDAAAVKKLGVLGGRGSRKGGEASRRDAHIRRDDPTDSRYSKTSWIWTGDGLQGDDEYLHECKCILNVCVIYLTVSRCSHRVGQSFGSENTLD